MSPPILHGRSTFELGDHRTQTRFLEGMSTFDMEDHDLDVEHHQCHNAPVEVSYGFRGSFWRRTFGEVAMAITRGVSSTTTPTPYGNKHTSKNAICICVYFLILQTNYEDQVLPVGP